MIENSKRLTPIAGRRWLYLPIILLLLTLTLIFYSPIALAGRILVSYDIFTYFYPYRDFAAESLRQGNVPLWNPYLFSGVPFLANIQTAVFYPLNLLLLPFDAPQAISLSIVTHVFLAGLFMFAFATVSLRLDKLSALLAAVVFMFSGFMSQQVGHVNQLNASVWLPLLFMLVELAYRRGSLVYALLSGIVIAMIVLAGHPQEAYLSLVGLGIFTLFLILRRISEQRNSDPRAGLISWPSLRAGLLGLGLLITATLIGAGLTAFQLLPTQEISAESIRSGGMTFREASTFSLPPREILRSLLPGFREIIFSEYIAYVGILPLSLAVLAFWRRRDNPYTWLAIVLVVVALFFAMGGYNPLYEKAYRLVPGINLFRVPARWLYLYTFGMSMAAGIGMNSLGLGEKVRSLLSSRSTSRILSNNGLEPFLLAYIIFVAIIGIAVPWLAVPRSKILLLWGGLFAVGLSAITIGRALVPGNKLKLIILLAGAAELFFASRNLDLNRAVLPEAYTSLRPTITQLSLDKSQFRILSIASSGYVPGDAKEQREILSQELESVLIDDYLISNKYKEIMTPNIPLKYRIASIDGYDGGVLPLKRYVEFKKLLLDSGGLMPEHAIKENPNQPDAVLRDQLAGIPDTKLLGALNIKYIIADKRHDPWVDNVYFDLTNPLEIGPGKKIRIETLPNLEVNSLGVVSYLSGLEKLPQSEPVAKITVVDSKGNSQDFLLRAGVDTAEGRYQAKKDSINHGQARIASTWKTDPQAHNYYTKLALDRLIYPKEIWIEYMQPAGKLHLGGISVIDDRATALGGAPTSESIVLNQRLKLVHSGDLKIYQNLDWLPRAFIVSQAKIAGNKDSALAALKEGIGNMVVLAESPMSRAVLQLTTDIPKSGGTPSTAEQKSQGVKFLAYEPERISIEATLEQNGFLVLTDTYYPGWRAWVDGKEVEILRADHLFRALYLTKGQHQIEFKYQPNSFRLGLLITVATTIIVALALIFSRKRLATAAQRFLEGR